ncbi:hypothetical protein OESDEN_11799 [Oesophagostomum dentatum]|uniref:Uncharacterized protein n=1 Tax=Oesophagostomum dentatum TaxID=61180 RepID=A0A0B1SSW9_OESDE|nr:hypothetical protein OESDEN_11799 [Oesophagostomum dentatum]
MFRSGIMQLMHQTLDEVPEGGSEEEESSRRSSSPPPSLPSPKTELTVPICHDRRSSQIEEIVQVRKRASLFQKSILEEEEDQPLNMEWPDNFTKQVTYICLAPVLIPMWVTIPDVRRPCNCGKKGTGRHGSVKFSRKQHLRRLCWPTFLNAAMISAVIEG